MPERHDNSPHVLSYDLEGYPRQEERFPDRQSAVLRQSELEGRSEVSGFSIDLEGNSPATQEQEPSSAESQTIRIEIVAQVFEGTPSADPADPDADEPASQQ